MRLLPRSRRGTWLLATAVWAAACTGWWWVLPTAPRMVVRFPEGTQVLGVSPHGVAVTQPKSEFTRAADNALQISDLTTGQVIFDLANPSGFMAVWDRSTDGSIWLLSEWSPQGQRVLKLDLAARKLVEVYRDVDAAGVRLSGDGQFAAIHDSRRDGLIVWNVAENRLHEFVPKLAPPFRYSRNGRRVAGIAKWDSELRIYDIDSRQVRSKLDWPPTRRLDQFVLDDSGDRVAGVFRDFSSGPFGRIVAEELFCWDALLGETTMLDHRQLNQGEQQVSTQFGVGANDLIAILGYWGPDFRFIEIDAGGRVTDRTRVVGNGSFQLSPDGRVLLLYAMDGDGGILAEWATKLGINWPFQQGESARLFDARSGRSLGRAVGSGAGMSPGGPDDLSFLTWSPDSRYLIAVSPDAAPVVRVFDIPPRKPLMWFAAGAMLFALPIAWLAWLRVRKLQVAAQPIQAQLSI